MSFFTTRSTGRLVINNAIIDSYISELLAMAPGARLSFEGVLARATAPFMRKGSEGGLRDDASFYRVSRAAVLTAILFDEHERRYAGLE
jgi:hypothetical protein